jgi:hypothetical protein
MMYINGEFEIELDQRSLDLMKKKRLASTAESLLNEVS